MKKYTYLIYVLILLLLFAVSNYAQNTKLAQTGMKFLSVSTDARASGLGEAYTSLHGGSEAMFYNPAGMALMQNFADVSFGQTGWIADINYMHAAAAFNPFGNDYYGVFGISIVAVDYGELQQTVRAQNEQGFLDVGTFSPTAISIGIGYARALSEKFSVGGNVKYVQQNLVNGIVDVSGDPAFVKDKFELGVMAFDFGVIYKTGFKSLNIGMNIRNFSSEIEYIEEGFQLPLTFKIGASIDAFDLTDIDVETHSLLVTVDASHPRDFKEQMMIGGEYTFIKTFSVRAGYNFPNDERGFSAGVGVRRDIGGVTLGVDYAYAPFGVFDTVHRFTVKFAY